MSNVELKDKEIEIKKPFRTILDPPKVTVTPSGTKEEDIWQLKIDEKGNETFYIAGKTNVYEKIQAHLEETKLENILAKCIDTGDTTLLEQRQGFYADISEMPSTWIEAQNKIKNAENIFNNLPLEVRKQYDNNFNKYLADVGSKTWLKNMGLLKEEAKEETANNEVTEKETSTNE